MELRLFHYWRSSCSWRVRWALALKGISYTAIAVNLLNDESESPEHLARNPMGYVPALEILPGQFLCESIAILEYLEETNPAPHLLPKDPLDRAQVRQLVETINAGTQPLQNTIVAPLYSENLENQKKWNQTWIRKGLRAYEILAKGQAGEFSWGNTLTLADLVLIPQCYNAIRQGLSLAEFPLIESIYNHASKTESFQISAPERFQP